MLIIITVCDVWLNGKAKYKYDDDNEQHPLEFPYSFSQIKITAISAIFFLLSTFKMRN